MGKKHNATKSRKSKNPRSDSLYKYTSLEHLDDVLKHGIYASCVQDLNDPYECKFIPEDKTANYRTVCLTRSRNKKAMWTYYANGHKGCSIQIALPKDYGTDNCLLRRIRYTTLQEMNTLRSEKNYGELLYYKDEKWSEENEVRAVWSPENKDDPCWHTIGENVYFTVEIKQIAFGCVSHKDDNYLKALLSIQNYNNTHKHKINVVKYIMANDRFRFDYDKSFCYEEEILKYQKK